MYNMYNNYNKRITDGYSLSDLEKNWRSTKVEIKLKKDNNKINKNNNKKDNLYKTQLCDTYEEFGRCNYGINCQYAHGRNELKKKPIIKQPTAFKTVRCKNYWSKKFTCPYGDKCKFVHEEAVGIDNKKALKISTHKKYKTRECETFNNLGTCPYGDKCAFIHKKNIINNKEEEILLSSDISINNKNSTEDFEKNSLIHLWSS
jgi:hypothetical protein